MAPRRPSDPHPLRPDRPRPAGIKTFMVGGVRLRRTPVALARRFFQIVTDAASEALSQEVKPQHLAALVALSKETGEPGIDQNGLAARLGLERARVSQLVDEMEGLGLIDRRVNGADRRARLLRLTPQGEQLRARIHPRGLAAQARILAVLPPADRELLLDLLTRVIQLNAAPARASGPPSTPERKRTSRLSISEET
jgi:DNA-binding MarR family transcriptional regulator